MLLSPSGLLFFHKKWIALCKRKSQSILKGLEVAVGKIQVHPSHLPHPSCGGVPVLCLSRPHNGRSSTLSSTRCFDTQMLNPPTSVSIKPYLT